MSIRSTLNKVVLVDDDPVLAAIVRHQLAAQGIECVHIATFGAACQFLDQLLAPGRRKDSDIDAVILDYYLDDGHTGLQLCRMIRDRSELPILMLTGEKSVETTVRCLEEGADHYICKPFNLDELLARIRASVRARGTQHNWQELAKEAGLEVNLDERELSFQGNQVRLTEKESRLADALLRNVGSEVSKEKLFEHVCGRYHGINSRSIDMLVGRLRKKLALAGTRLVIFSARNYGYKLVVRQDD